MVLRRTATPPAIDGKLDDWDMTRSVGIAVDENHGAVIAAAIDDKNLYLAFDVVDPYPMRNQGPDRFLLFKSGSAVDLMLGTDPGAAPGRGRPVAGDLRLLLSELDGKPVAVLYRAVAPGAADPMGFSSPNVTVKFDSVHELPAARIAIDRGGRGYRLEAEVALEDLDWKPTKGGVYSGDVGVVFSDDTGTRNTLRAYWSNKKTNLTADVGEESRLAPCEWGELRVE